MKDLDLILRDYEVQMNAQRQLNYEADAAEVRRAEQAKIAFADRLASQVGKPVVFQGVNGETWGGVLKNLGLGWVQVSSEAGELIVPLTSICWWDGGSLRSVAAADDVSRKLTLGYVLRALAAAHSSVVISHLGGETLMTEGKIFAVGADYLDLVQHKTVASSGKNAPGVRTVPFSSIAVMRVK